MRNSVSSIDTISSEISSSLIEMTGALAIAKNNEKKKMLRSNQETLSIIDVLEHCRDSLNKNFQNLIVFCGHAIGGIEAKINDMDARLDAKMNDMDSKLDEIQDNMSRESTEQHNTVISSISQMNTKLQELNDQVFNSIADRVSDDDPNIQSLMDQINSQFDELKKSPSITSEQLNQQFEELITKTDETNDYTCSNLDALSSHVEALNRNITTLYDLIKPPELNRDYIESAKYIIENVKNNQGKSIKSGSITVSNVAAILEAYDRMVKHSKPTK